MSRRIDPTRPTVLACIALLAVACGREAPEVAVDAGAGGPDRAKAAEATPAGEDGAGDGPESQPTPAPGPPKRIYAARYVGNVRAAPDRDADRIGYLRAGAVLQAKTAAPVGHEGCRGGWYELTTGGFVCDGRTVTAFEGERLPERQPAQPDLEAKLPYRYGVSRRDRVPVYRRLPTDEEAAEHEGYVIPGTEPPKAEGAPAGDGAARGGEGDEGDADEGDPSEGDGADDGPGAGAGRDAEAGGGAGEAAGGAAASGGRASAGAAAGGGATTERATAGSGQGEGAGGATAGGAGASGGAEARSGAEAAAEGDDALALLDEEELDAGPPTLEDLMADDDSVVMRWMMKGFYVSLDRDFGIGRRRYWRTLSNGYIPYRSLYEVDGSDFQGVVVDGRTWSLPIGFLLSSRDRAYTVDARGRLRRGQAPGYHHVFRIVGEEEHSGTSYYVADDGRRFRVRDVTRIGRSPRPDEVGAGEKWIDVDLTHQTLVAYEGDTPVFATLVSTGRIEDPDDPAQNHATPSGTFRITSKHLAGMMDGDNAIDGPYSIEDVPYVMYFELAYAFHTAFWHNRFGRTKSHGCVNMSPRDARHLFGWADPPLPEGWHGAYPTEETPGTWVHVHGETPEG